MLFYLIDDINIRKDVLTDFHYENLIHIEEYNHVQIYVS